MIVRAKRDILGWRTAPVNDLRKIHCAGPLTCEKAHVQNVRRRIQDRLDRHRDQLCRAPDLRKGSFDLGCASKAHSFVMEGGARALQLGHDAAVRHSDRPWFERTEQRAPLPPQSYDWPDP